MAAVLADSPLGNPYWNDGHEAAQALMKACLEQFHRWQVGRIYADGALPVPGVYGIPEQWPHIAQLYTDNGFTSPADGAEILHLADLADVPEPGDPPLDRVHIERMVGINGTRLSAYLDQECLGYIEIDVLDSAERRPSHGGLADVGNLHVAEQYRRQGLGTWLLRHAAQWLRLGHVNRLLHYASPEEAPEIAFVERNRFQQVTRTRRGWERSV
jgi:GNAT superfamily N-acetyltransferase